MSQSIKLHSGERESFVIERKISETMMSKIREGYLDDGVGFRIVTGKLNAIREVFNKGVFQNVWTINVGDEVFISKDDFFIDGISKLKGELSIVQIEGRDEEYITVMAVSDKGVTIDSMDIVNYKHGKKNFDEMLRLSLVGGLIGLLYLLLPLSLHTFPLSFLSYFLSQTTIFEISEGMKLTGVMGMSLIGIGALWRARTHWDRLRGILRKKVLS